MISTTTVNHVKRHVYIYGYIDTPKEFEEEISKWDSEWDYPNETVIVHINSNGGSLSSMNALSIRLQKVGKLLTVAEGDCCSAALYIYLLGHLRAASTNTIFMAHNVMLSYGAGINTVSNAKEFTDFTAKLAENLLDKYFKIPKYLNKNEIKSIIDGKEMYFDYEDAFIRGIVNCSLDDILLI